MQESQLPGQKFSIRIKMADKLKELRYTKYHLSFANWFERLLRKLRVLILKIDNLFVSWMHNTKEKSHTFNIRAKAWLVKKHIEDVQQQNQIEAIVQEKAEEEEDRDEEPKSESTDTERQLVNEIIKSPKSADLYKKLAEFYVSQGNPKDAKSAYLEVLKLCPADQKVLEKMDELDKSN
ncbi:MAG: hypothetical protein COU81_02775 [Candidatus Portnoybacteria bacterium CG10_big_fil_rev_8_21_14_0_10_36_7]|uniref:Uncharacterized protein n=1 Tax=Candidatus Portnoybacteria bacterium CG10_big_fil_rev_8_21_14_0_10_36_7 TaxID=1974812 RepID=A0A2M8KDR1_9BACT|nr:MAG: hypothetical protein COU81_02775 [Candidatus Portnoybacteria bacterium CG10_big_fil_rev_8_21_14_0_10_36_7]